MSTNRKRSTRKVLLVVAAVAVVAFTAAGIWVATRPAAAPQERTIAARTTTLRQTIESSGTIEPAQQANLNFGAAGQVTAVNVAVGQQVAAGQPLATVSSASLTASVAEAKSALAADQAKLTTDTNNNAASAQVTADQAAVTAAQNQVTNAQNALSGATLTAPFAGTVAALNLTVGQQVTAGGSSTGSSSSSGSSGGASSGGSGSSGGAGQPTGGSGSSGGSGSAGGSGGSQGGSSGSSGGSGSSGSSSSASTAQVVVISTGQFIVDASVDDTQVGQVKPGDTVNITPNGSTTPLPGTVSDVGMLAKSGSSVPSYPVTITVTGNPPGLFAGAGAAVSIVVKEVTGAVVVPAVAIHYGKGSPYVLEGLGAAQSQHPVTVGMTENGLTQITSGVSAGDEVTVPASAVGGSRSGTGAGNGRGQGGGGFGFGGGGLGGGGGGRGGSSGGARPSGGSGNGG